MKVDCRTGLPITPLTCRHRHCYEHLLLLVPAQQVEIRPADDPSPSIAAQLGEGFPANPSTSMLAQHLEGCPTADPSPSMPSQRSLQAGGSSSKGTIDTPWSALLPPDGFALFSTPGEHSRKPSASTLAGLVLQLMGPDGSHLTSGDGSHLTSGDPLRCLELFGRELLPDWTTWGNEVLHFQEAE